MGFKFINFVFFFLLILFSLNFIFAINGNIAICGNGLLEGGEECDAGQIGYAGNGNYINLGPLNCPLSSCSCDGVGTNSLSFSNGSTCISVSECADCDADLKCLPDMYGWGCNFQNVCSDEDSDFNECQTASNVYGQSECCSFFEQVFVDPDKPGCVNTYCTDVLDGSYCKWDGIGGSGTDLGGHCCLPSERCEENVGCVSDENQCGPEELNYCSFSDECCTQGQTCVQDIGCVDNYCAQTNSNNICVGVEGNCCSEGNRCVNDQCIRDPFGIDNYFNAYSVIDFSPSSDDSSRFIKCNVSFVPTEEGTYAITLYLQDKDNTRINVGSTNERVTSADDCSESFSPSPVTFEKVSQTSLNSDTPTYRCFVDITLTPESGSTINGNTTSAQLLDIDHDGVSRDAGDCDDFPFDDENTADSEFDCVSSSGLSWGEYIQEIGDKSCFNDTNNNGIGDYAACSYCRNPRVAERADNIDNNCWGTCQGNSSATGTRTFTYFPDSRFNNVTTFTTTLNCNITDYTGDGGDDSYTGEYVISHNNTRNTTNTKLSSPIGCGDVVNEYGQQDNFCQMVDDNIRTDNGQVCNGYNRVVLWGEKVISQRPLVYSDLAGSSEYTEKKIISFIPGGVNQQNSKCSFSVTYENLDRSIMGLGKYARLVSGLPLSPGELNSYSLEKVYLDNFFGPNFYEIFVKHDNYDDCLPSSESNTKRRETSDLPDQFIDSVYGDLDFSKFTISNNLLTIRNSSGEFEWQWQTACVSKDKCNDGVNNAGPKNLFKTEPYGFFLTPVKKVTIGDGANSPVYTISSEFNISLVDIDNPECKFNVAREVDQNYFAPKVYSTPEHKLNEITGSAYCLDDDGDGFCGANMKRYNSGGILEDCLAIGFPLPSFSCVPDTADNTLILSKQFPDCDDGLYNDQYKIGDQPLLVSKVLGWPEDFVGQRFGSWNVHPLSSVNKYTCTLGSSSEGASYGYDFNCNKNGVDGVNMDLLKQGDTPFDFYYTTGIENLAYGSDSPWYKQILIQDKRDANCYEYPPYRDATVQLAISSAAAALSLGIGGIAAGGFTYGGIISRGVFSVATDLTLDSDLRQICFGNSPQGSFCAARLGLTFFIGAATGGQSGGLIGKVNTKTGKISFSSNLASTSTKPLRPLSADILSSGENALEGRAKNVLKESFEIPGSVCFDGDTLISMADGEVKEIQNISVGEKVLSYNLTSHSYIFSEVKIISKHFSEDIYLINNKTRVTSGHPFWTKEYGWAAINNSEIKEHPELELAKLSVGLHLLDENGSYVELGSIERIYNISLEVYNFVDLAENHNYFADGVLVHNQGNPCGKLQGIVDNPVLSRQQTYKNILGAGGSFKDEVFKQLFSSFMARNTLTSSNFENLVLEATDLLQKHSFLFPKKADPKFKILSLGKKMFAQNKYLVTESNAKLIESETNFYYSFATKLRQRFTSRGSNLPFSDDIVIGGQKYVRFNKVFNDDEGVPTYFVTHLQPADGNMQKSYLYLEDFKKGSPYFNRYITKDFLELGDSELLSLSSYDGSPINNHLKNLITIVNSPESTREAKAKAIAAFEWIFFSANPVGRGGASIGDVLSNMLQQQAGFRLRSQFVSQDFEALSTSYADYLASRSVQLLSQ